MGDQSMSSTAFYGVTRSFRDQSFSTFAKLFEKLLFFTPDTHKYVCIEEGKKCLFFGKFCVRTK